MALSDFLNTGSTSGPTGFTSSVSGLPDYFQTYGSAILNRGNAIASEPYQQYTGQRVAGFTPDQTQAQTAVQSNQGVYQPFINQAQGYTTNAASPFNGSSLTNYMNPYMSNVTDQIAQLGARNLSENIMPQINSSFTGNGMYGSSRHGDFLERAVRDTNNDILNQQSTALQSGYNNAMNAYQTDQNRQLQAGQQSAALGQMLQSMGYNDAAQLDTVGQQQQALQQKNMDTAYGDFQNQQQYPTQQLYMLSDMLRGTSAAMPKTTTTTQQTAMPTASPLAYLGSSLMGIGALNGNNQQVTH